MQQAYQKNYTHWLHRAHPFQLNFTNKQSPPIQQNIVYNITGYTISNHLGLRVQPGEEEVDSINQSVNYNGGGRAAPVSPGLVINQALL